jgi:predicted amidophosphoribosyltransferase
MIGRQGEDWYQRRLSDTVLMSKPATTTCDACGREYEFANRRDRCPVCCPKPEPEPDAYEMDDWELGDYPEPE